MSFFEEKFPQVKSSGSLKFFGKAMYDDFPSPKTSIWMWNINGLNSVINKGSLQAFLTKANPDIVCFNEIKTDEGMIEKKQMHKQIPIEYDQYWNTSKEKKGYSGTGVLTKIRPLSVEYDIGIPEHSKEGRVITVEYNQFILVVVYTPNSKDDLSRL